MRKTRYHHGDLRRALLDVARSRIAADGIEGWSLKAAALDLGVTHAAAYKHFANKADLVRGVSDDVMTSFAEALRGATADAESDEGAYLAIARAVVAFACRSPRLYALAFGEARSDDRDSLRRADPETAFGVLRGQIEGWQRSGWLGAGDPLEIAMVLWSTAHGLAMLVSTGRLDLSPDDAQALSDTVMGNLRRGLGPR